MLDRNLYVRYGRAAEIDFKIGSIRKAIKHGNPNKRYMLITTENEKEYFVNLIEARWLVLQSPDKYRPVTQEDVDAEISTRGHRIKGGKWAEVIKESENAFVISFRDQVYTLIKQKVADDNCMDTMDFRSEDDTQANTEITEPQHQPNQEEQLIH